MKRLKKFFQLTAQERLFFIKAVFWSAFAGVIITILPFKWFAPYLGEHQKETPYSSQNENLDLIIEISKAIKRASKHVPWKYKCFAQSITAKRMLKEKKINSTLYLGVTKDNSNKMTAHAWVRQGNIIVVGEKEMEKFTVVSTFA